MQRVNIKCLEPFEHFDALTSHVFCEKTKPRSSCEMTADKRKATSETQTVANH
jgi:hypothetical protein